MIKKCAAEFIGTMVLVMFGCGVAAATGCSDNAGIVATALAFGLAIVAMAYSIGNISGCHVNPAVSFGMLISKKMSGKEFLSYVCAQILGALAGSLVLYLIFGADNLGQNLVQSVLIDSYGATGALFLGLLVEIILTCVFVFVILYVTSKAENKTISGLLIGLTLTFVHLLGIRLTGTSVNPARSLAPAIWNMLSGSAAAFDAIKQIWIFILGPLLGAAAAALLFKYFEGKKEKKAQPASPERSAQEQSDKQ